MVAFTTLSQWPFSIHHFFITSRSLSVAHRQSLLGTCFSILAYGKNNASVKIRHPAQTGQGQKLFDLSCALASGSRKGFEKVQ